MDRGLLMSFLLLSTAIMSFTQICHLKPRRPEATSTSLGPETSWTDHHTAETCIAVRQNQYSTLFARNENDAIRIKDRYWQQVKKKKRKRKNRLCACMRLYLVPLANVIYTYTINPEKHIVIFKKHMLPSRWHNFPRTSMNFSTGQHKVTFYTHYRSMDEEEEEGTGAERASRPNDRKCGNIWVFFSDHKCNSRSILVHVQTHL